VGRARDAECEVAERGEEKVKNRCTDGEESRGSGERWQWGRTEDEKK
jgi:hypothetical protein